MVELTFRQCYGKQRPGDFTAGATLETKMEIYKKTDRPVVVRVTITQCANKENKETSKTLTVHKSNLEEVYSTVVKAIEEN